MQSQLLILVPGLAGSKLYCNCSDVKRKRLYPRKKWFFFNSAIDKHLYECENITTKPLKSFWTMSIYKNFLQKISSSYFNRVEVFSYNWCDNPIKIANNLLAFLKRCNPNQFSQIKLIGHSLGGLIIRIMIEYLNALIQLNIPTEKMAVFQCGTPMYGSENLSDYNYGFELATVMVSLGNIIHSPCSLYKIKKKDIKKIKPFLFSQNDLKILLQKTPESFFYLLPTPMINIMHELIHDGNLHIDSRIDFNQVHFVHSTLSLLQFPIRYVYFYNISCQRVEDVYIPFKNKKMKSEINIHDIKPVGGGRTRHNECGVNLNRLLKSDGLVVPYSTGKIPNNCNIYVDESENCRHAYIMNSKELWRIIYHFYCNETLVTFDDDDDDDVLPHYNDI